MAGTIGWVVADISKESNQERSCNELPGKSKNLGNITDRTTDKTKKMYFPNLTILAS